MASPHPAAAEFAAAAARQLGPGAPGRVARLLELPPPALAEALAADVELLAFVFQNVDLLYLGAHPRADEVGAAVLECVGRLGP